MEKFPRCPQVPVVVKINLIQTKRGFYALITIYFDVKLTVIDMW